MPETVIQQLTQFGVAGLMGVLWVWERLHSRRRETQLSQAHDLLTRHQEQLHELLELVRRNTAAIERFEQTQNRLHKLLERMNHEPQAHAA